MNRLIRILTPSLFLALLWISCSKQESLRDKLQYVQQVMEGNPKEALNVLESITSPENLSSEDYMTYVVLNVDAKRKNNLSVAQEFRIFDAVTYFENKNNVQMSAAANFLAAAVSYYNNELKNAEQFYLKSAKISTEINDMQMVAKSYHGIGIISYEKNKFGEAIFYFNLALTYYSKTKNSSDSVLINLKLITYIGRSYQAKNEYSTAEKYFQKMHELAEGLKNQEYIGYSYLNLGLINFNNNNFSTAISYLHEALPLMQTKIDTIKVHANLARTYLAKNVPDSVNIHIQMVEKSIVDINDKHTLEFAYITLEEFYQSKGNTTQALMYAQKLRNVQEKINDNRLQNQINRAEEKKELAVAYQKKVAKEKTTFMVIIFIISIIVVAVVAVVLVTRAKKMIWQKYELEMDMDLNMWNKVCHFVIYNPYFNNYPNLIRLSAAEIIASITESVTLKKDVEGYVNRYIDSFHHEVRYQLIKLGKGRIEMLKSGKQILNLLSDQDILNIMFIRQQLPIQIVSMITNNDVSDNIEYENTILNLSIRLSNKHIPQEDMDALFYRNKQDTY